jgi:sugar/nucleoside kinase (ribokinase family)
MGAEGVLIYETKGSFTHFKAGSIGPNEIKSVVGAGDCFLAGFIYGLVHN